MSDGGMSLLDEASIKAISNIPSNKVRGEFAKRVGQSFTRAIDDPEIVKMLGQAQFDEGVRSALKAQFVKDMIFINTPSNIRRTGNFLPDGTAMRSFQSSRKEVMDQLFTPKELEVIDNFTIWAEKVFDDAKELKDVGVLATGS